MKRCIYIFLLQMMFIFTAASAFGATIEYLSLYETEYEVFDLGLIHDGSTSLGYGVSNSMTVVGDAANGTGMQHAFVYSNGYMDLIGDTTSFSKATAVNDAGQVAGYRDTGNGATKSYIYQGGTFATLDTPGVSSYAYGMNNWGHVVGSYQTSSGETNAFLYDGIDSRDIGALGGNLTIAKDISDLGGVTGYGTTEGGNDHAFVYSAGTGEMTDIGTLGGLNSYGNAINRYGHAVGESETANHNEIHAFYYDGETMQDIGTLGGSESSANGINAFGFVVGYSETEDGDYHAFLYHEQAFWYENVTMIDLNDFIAEDSGWDTIVNAYDINEWGQIVGVGLIDGEMHAYLMNPLDVDYSQVPIPGTVLMLGSCITLLGISKRRSA